MMLELGILGLLKERAMHGYELRKQLSQKLGLFWTVSFGSLYPTLRRLEKRGAVQKIFPEDTTTRRKQVYRITDRGEREFLEMLSEGASNAFEEDKFSLRVAFFRYLKPETRIRLLERRKAYLQDKLEEGRLALLRAQRGRADSYTLSLMRHGMDTTQADVAWLDELINAESTQLADPEAAVDDATSAATAGDGPSRSEVGSEPAEEAPRGADAAAQDSTHTLKTT